MRINKNKWFFHEHIPNRAPLSSEQTVYWKNILRKILKVGLEFEFNLPENKNGACTGNDPACPCKHMTANNSCWSECIVADCVNKKVNPDTCSNATPTCDPEDCANCQFYKSKCPGIFCANFISACIACPNYSVDCANCSLYSSPENNPDFIRENLNKELRPNNSYGQVGDLGVHSITTDGSLLGKKGAEVITVGRRVDYWEFYKMSKAIIDTSVARGAYVNERCSTHMHVLAGYYGKTVNSQESIPNKITELEKDMPEIILANLHQLVRRYQNAMTWLSMGLNEPERLTRWEKFRVSVIDISALDRPMHEIMEHVSAAAGGKKYGWINYNQMQFNPSNNYNINRFHVEFRGADCLVSPSAAAALACMYYALIIKAVEISRYGLTEVGDAEWLTDTLKVKHTLMNNKSDYDSGNRFSDTSNLKQYYELLISESIELIQQLKPILMSVGPAFDVLEKLAEKPCALRRVEGKNWQEIEEELKVVVNEEDNLEIAVSEIITLNQVSECASIEDWVEAVTSFISKSSEFNKYENIKDIIENYVNKNRDDGKLVWSARIGAPILV